MSLATIEEKDYFPSQDSPPRSRPSQHHPSVSFAFPTEPPKFSGDRTDSSGSSQDGADLKHDAYKPYHETPKLSYEFDRRKEIERIGSYHGARRGMSRHDSVLTALARPRRALSERQSFNHPLENVVTSPDVVVGFDNEEDPYRPLNWPVRQKIITTFLYAFTTMGATFGSAVYSAAIPQISHDFHISKLVATLGIALMMAGMGIGPMLWGPLSEVYGRKPAVLVPYFIAICFTFGTAAAKDVQTIMITRFFAGFFGSAPVTNTGGVLADIWAPEQRGIALVGYAIAVGGGPTLGPVVGGAICQKYSWRWTEYTTGIFTSIILILDILFVSESYPPILLTYKASRLRIETGNYALHAKHEEWDVSIREMFNKYGVRPFQLMFTPICLCMCSYASFVYGLLYALLGAIPVEFQEKRGWGQLVGALPFMAVLVGELLASIVNIFNARYYSARFQANNKRPVPEARLPAMMLGSLILPTGLFVFAWTSSPSIHWICPVIGAALIGCGFFMIFQSALNYLVDTFMSYSASAVAANTFLRAVLAVALPIVITPMLHNMGVDWGMSVFACIALIAIPIPFLFFVYGSRIREQSVWSRDRTA